MSFIRTGGADGESRLFVHHDLEPAPEGDLAFIVRARNSLERFADVLAGADASIGMHELDELDMAAEHATAGPWRGWIEGRDACGGCSIVSIGGDDFGPDMYLRLGDQDAPAALFDLVAHLRQDLPLIVAEIRRRRAG